MNFTNFSKHSLLAFEEILDRYKIVCYGAGSGLDTFRSFIIDKFEVQIEAVLDKRYEKLNWNSGICYASPNEYKLQDEDKKPYIVIVTVGKKKLHQEIFHQLKIIGFKNIILASSIYEYHLHYMSVDDIRSGSDYYHQYKNEIDTAARLFADHESRQVYKALLEIYTKHRMADIPNHDISKQYFPSDIIPLNTYRRFVNCGAYNGDTVKQLIKKVGKIELLICFEPDPKNFRQLQEYLHSNKEKIAENIIALPCGIFDSAKQLYFESGCNVNSVISERGDILIQCVSLDQTLLGIAPTFIQMDIEGAEMEAIHGMIEIIQNGCANLAISIYHEPSHLWKIPILIHSLQCEYRLYLRNYSGIVTDTVLYAVKIK